MTDIQKVILNIFKAVAKICDDNGIPYFAIGGTCIGAVRHKGFIPWDDDIDIAIPIERFEEFKQKAVESLPHHLKLYGCTEIKHCHHIFYKVIDENSTFIENIQMEFPDAYKGVYVDIMPISGIPKPGLSRKIFAAKIQWLAFLNRIRRFPKSYIKGRPQKFCQLIFTPINKIVSFNFYSNKWYQLLKKHPVYSADNVGYVWGKIKERLIFEKSWFADTISLPFEDTYMKCPIGYDKYLTRQFGDYMHLPPIDEQLTKHEGIVDLERSYIEYQKNPCLINKYIREENK